MSHYGTLRSKHVYSNFNKVQKTPAGGGYHVWHDELGQSVQHSDRVLAWMMYLNNDFEGGETEFPHHNLTVKPKTGTVLVFPPTWQYPHRGIPVESGNPKYILSTYLHYQ